MTDQILLPLQVRELPCSSVLYCLPNNSKLCRIQAVVRTGSIHEADDTGCGLSHFLEHMLFQGCSRYPGNSASDTVHKMGGDCNAYTTFDHTSYYVEVPLEKFAEGADILTSMISEPLFPEEKFISEKEVIAREADMIFDRPVYRLIQQLWQGLYQEHPAGMPIVGYPDKIANVTRDTMIAYYRRRYGQMRCHWLISGNINADVAAGILADKLANFARGNLNEPLLPTPPEPMFESAYSCEFADPLTRIALGIRGPRPSDQFTPALDLLAGIIGGNDSSYLPGKFIYQDQLALALDAEFDTMSFGSLMAISAACEPDKAEQLQQGIRSQLALIRKRGVNAEDLAQEKLQQRITLLQQLKNSSSSLNIINTLRMNFNNAECLDEYLQKIESVTLDQVNAAAEEYLDPRRFVWSTVCPPAEKTSVAMTANAAFDPQIKSGRLDDQSSFVTIERNNIPIDSLSVLLPAGPVWENGYPHGISQLLSKMLTTGPDDISEEEFYALLDRRGIDLDISCGNNTLSLEMSFLPGERQFATEMMQRLLTNPRRTASVFERVKNNLIEQLTSKLMETNFAAIMHAKRKLFGNHPGGNSRLESVEALEAITPDELYSFYFSRLDKNLVNFGATVQPGDPDDEKAVMGLLNTLSSNLPWSDQALVKPQPITSEELSKQYTSEVSRVELPREQSTVVCALAGGFAHTREFYALLIMDAALNGLASNLFKEVREKRSLAYTTGVAINSGLVQGVIALYAGVKPSNAMQALDCLLNEVKRLRENGLTPEEFASARLAAISAMARQLESVDAQLIHSQLAMFYGENPQHSLKSSEILAAMTYEECNDIIKRILSFSQAACVIAGGVEK